MEARKLCTLVALVSLLALASFVSSQPQEDPVQADDSKKTKASNKDSEQEELAQAKYNNVCNTEVCKNRANLINSYVDNSISPCEDFYSYVCNNWTSRHKDTGPDDSFQMLQQKYVALLTDILTRKKPTYMSPGVTHKPTILFESCIASTEKDESEAFSEIMRASELTEWPMTNESGKEKFKNATEVLLKVGMSPLIQFNVKRSSSSQDAHGIKIFPLGVILPEEVYIRGNVTSVKTNITEDDLQSVIYTLTTLQNQLLTQLRATLSKSPLRGAPSEVTTIGSLDGNFANIPLRSLLSKDFDKINISLEENESVEVFRLWFYEAINEFLQSADPVGLYNYIGLHSVLHWLPRRSSKVHTEETKRKHCVGVVHKAMQEVVSYLYAMEYFGIAAKMEVEEIVKKLKNAFEDAIKTAQWMDDETRRTAQKKLTNMVAKIGYPTWLLNTTVLENLYEYVPNLPSNMSFLKMMYIIDENTEMKTMEKLRQPYKNDEEWFFSESLVYAFFNPRGNEFVYPLGGLQYPFYEHGLPWSLNFGAIGAVMAHEMTHAFAGKLSHYTESGTMVHSPENGRSGKFNEIAQCFMHQYGNITDKEAGIPLNGTKALDENMADNGGLHIALTAYNKLVMENCENTTTSLEGLPGMSGIKLFFLSYGMLWCHAMSEEELKNKIANTSHSTNRYRANVPVHNLAAFATAFNCSMESQMVKNFTDTCTLW